MNIARFAKPMFPRIVIVSMGGEAVFNCRIAHKHHKLKFLDNMKAMVTEMKTPKIALLLLLLVALFLTSFAAVSAQDTTELSVTWWGSQNRHDRTIEVIEMFEAANPNIDVTYEFVGWTDYWTKVNTQVAGGNVACVMQQDYKFMTEWASRGLLRPLDDLVASGAIDTSNISESVLESGKVNGELYGISLGTNSQAIIIDADAFEAAGVELPAWDWTWEDFEAISNQIHEELGIWSIAYGIWDDPNIISLLLSSGQLMFSPDGTAIAVEDPSPVFEHLNRIRSLMESGAIAAMEEQADVSAGGHEDSPIVHGTEAMRYQWSNQIVSVYSAAGEDRNFVLYPLPRVEGGQSANYLKPSMFFSITDQCENVEEAAMFIDYFTNNLEANEVLAGERGVPVASQVREHLLANLDPVNAQIFEFIARVGEDASPVPPPEPTGYADLIANVFSPQFIDPVLFGMVSPEEGWQTFVAEGNIILEQNNGG